MAYACSTGWWPIITKSSARHFACTFVTTLAIAASAGGGSAQTGRGEHQAIEVDGHTLPFRMSVRSLSLQNDQGRVDCEVGSIAFVADGKGRPVTFVIGGGPGTSSAYLNLGATGPWRVDFSSGSPAALIPNPQTWLAFTDLVFLDPPGTGQGRLTKADAKAKERVWSVEGDIDLLSDAIAAWLRTEARQGASIAIAGQSYGGFRAPRLAEALHRRHGLAVKTLVLVSPILDYGWRYHARTSPLSYATLLPSFAAARMESEQRFDPIQLGEVELYARGAFIEDFLSGLQDGAAVARLIEAVTSITGLPRDVIETARGRVDEKLFGREFARKLGKVTSLYDGAISGDDPDPAAPRPDYADPFLSALKPRLTSAMEQMLRGQSSRRIAYNVANETVFQEWEWNADHGLPESVTALRKMLALDRELRVFVAHGYTDLHTPYFESALILRQLPDFGPGRVVQKTYRGGHMFYSRDDSRAAFHADIAAFMRRGSAAP